MKINKINHFYQIKPKVLLVINYLTYCNKIFIIQLNHTNKIRSKNTSKSAKIIYHPNKTI